jgi:dihydroorotate dehydrogenase
MIKQPFYDPTKSYQANYEEGPFGSFADSITDLRTSSTNQPQHNFMGIPVHEPFGIPAGPLVNGAYVQAALRHGFDIAVYKTVRTREYACHPFPNVLAVKVEGDLTLEKAQRPLESDTTYAEPLSITNSFGVPSRSPEFWQPDLAAAVQVAQPGQVVIGSFQGTKDSSGNPEAFIDDYVLAARQVAATGVKILEANLSCPNEGTADLLCFDVERVTAIARRIKEEIGDMPLLLKLAYFASDDHLRQMVEAVGEVADGLVVINTIPAPIVDSAGVQALPGEGRLYSGVCGASIQWAGMSMVKRLVTLRAETKTNFAIVGCGGVMSVADYVAYREAGADAVMSATGAMWNPHLAQEIKERKYDHTK